MKIYIYIVLLIASISIKKAHGQSDYIKSTVKTPPSPTAADTRSKTTGTYEYHYKQ